MDGPVLGSLSVVPDVRAAGAVHASPAGPSRGGIGTASAGRGSLIAVGRPAAAYRTTRDMNAAQGGAPTPYALGRARSQPTTKEWAVPQSTPPVTQTERHPMWCSPLCCQPADRAGDATLHVSEPRIVVTEHADHEVQVSEIDGEAYLHLTSKSRMDTLRCPECDAHVPMWCWSLLTPHEFDRLESLAWELLARRMAGAA